MKQGYETANCANYELLKQFAYTNRAHPTEAENLMWAMLSGKTLGVRFRRQHIIGDYIADFICIRKKLIIEIDGGYHHVLQQIALDEHRTERLNELGFRVLRFTNEEVLGNSEKVLETIKGIINESTE